MVTRQTAEEGLRRDQEVLVMECLAAQIGGIIAITAVVVIFVGCLICGIQEWFRKK